MWGLTLSNWIEVLAVLTFLGVVINYMQSLSRNQLSILELTKESKENSEACITRIKEVNAEALKVINNIVKKHDKQLIILIKEQKLQLQAVIVALNKGAK